MSYTRRFKKTIQVSYSGSVSYPKSEFGGTKHYSGTVSETIYFDVTVDTDPFDGSVKDMKNQVDLLTGSIVATEAAQVASVRDNSRRVGSTIVQGFFKTVQSDISQQVAALKIKTESLLGQLFELQKRLNDKQRQMGVDYGRITSRYSKTFEELNKELENRIYSLDEPVFRFADTTSKVSDGMNSHVGVPLVHAGENARLHSKITAAHAKQEAVNTIERAREFLKTQYRVDNLLRRCLHKGGNQGKISAPYCVMETVETGGHRSSRVFLPPMLEKVQQEALARPVLEAESSPAHILSDQRVKDYFNAELAAYLAATPTDHAKRVAQVTSQLFK